MLQTFEPIVIFPNSNPYSTVSPEHRSPAIYRIHLIFTFVDAAVKK